MSGITKAELCNFINSVINQNDKAMRGYLHEASVIRWHNTNECFTAEDYITANCKYPGDWTGRTELIERLEDGRFVAVVYVQNSDHSICCRCVSFFEIRENKITSIDEYWGDVGEPPEWRKSLNLGRPVY